MWPAFKTLVFVILVPGTVTVLIPINLLSSVPENGGAHSIPLQLFGAILVVLGAMVGFWSFGLFAFEGKGTPAPIDPPKNLVVSGPYRFVRNPMYVAMTAILLGESVFFGSARLLVYTGLCLAGFNLFVRFYEEPALKRKFGAAYEAHCRTVPRWIPRSRNAARKHAAPR